MKKHVLRKPVSHLVMFSPPRPMRSPTMLSGTIIYKIHTHRQEKIEDKTVESQKKSFNMGFNLGKYNLGGGGGVSTASLAFGGNIMRRGKSRGR
jgi:hypothetical protein